MTRRTRVIPAAVAIIAVLGIARNASAQQDRSVEVTTDSAAIVGTIERLNAALFAGDSAAVIRLLDDSAVVLESGRLESRAEYLRHHLPADMAFARGVRTVRAVRQVRQRGDVAWVVSTSHAAGTFDGRAVNSDGAELMVLIRTTSGWRIAAIHWSSHRARP
jgi:ketosteroid isomerase-like protein